jgi:hypothetical protein
MWLVTPTLINSFEFYRSYEGEDEAGKRQEFLNTLKRERFEPNEAMKKGIAFEAAIENYCTTGEGEGVVKEIGDIVNGGLWQEAVSKPFGDYLLYGKTDVIKADTIYDIKYTSSYDLGKFQNSIQHRIYLFCSGLPKFSYLISSGQEWWKEDYNNHSAIQHEINEKLKEFSSYLERDAEAGDLYYSKWESYGSKKKTA